ncbi:MAG TPA: shikimate dehydrogenase, partial [Actinomycetota bacterium]|nr:shikimate dehydrogenase [Actinomycetota bacterium]
MTLRIALLGSPVSGSPSPAMHRAAAAEAGVDLVYEPIDVRLPDLARRLRELRRTHHGLNVTRPLKHAVLGLLDEVAPSARHAGSVNTVVLRGGTATGHSTDGPGFLAALRRAGVPASGHAVVLGAGGAARAVAWALRDAGARVTLVGRNEAPTRRVAEALGIDAAADLTVALDTADLLVNATPIGGEVPGDPLPPDTPLPPVVFD